MLVHRNLLVRTGPERALAGIPRTRSPGQRRVAQLTAESGWTAAPRAAGVLLLLLGLARAGAEPALGEPANLARFGRVSLVSQGRSATGLEVRAVAQPTNTLPVALVTDSALEIAWDHPRAVRAVVLTFEAPAPPPEDIAIEWWHRIWPETGVGGWMKLDDPFNGRWTRVHAQSSESAGALRLDFAPLTAAEAPGVRQPGPAFRLTYKLRITCARLARLRHVAVFSDAVTQRARLRFEWGQRSTVRGEWAPSFEARNGWILGVTQPEQAAAVVDVEFADAEDRLSADRGAVVFRSGETRSFAVFVDDVLREGGLWVRDLGVFVSDAARGWTHATWPGPTGDVWREGTVAEQVARLPEQTLAQALAAIPPKPPSYLFLGVPNLRQEIALLPQGEIRLFANSLRSLGPDSALRPWTWEHLTYDFGTGEQPVMGPRRERRVTRRLEAGWLPVVQHQWDEGELRYVQTCLAAPLVGDLETLASQRGTETVVLASRFEMHNTGPAPRTAWLWLEMSPSLPCRLTVDDLLVLDQPSAGGERPGLLPVRGRFDRRSRGALDVAVLVPGSAGSYQTPLERSSAAREAIRYRVDLAPGESERLDLFVPYVELLDAAEVGALKALSFTNLHRAVVAYWRQRIQRGMTYEVPEPHLNDFFKANLWHVLISTDLDPFTGQHQHGAATHGYKNFLNETAMVARSLEMRGEHAAAVRLLETFLANQGAKALPGKFQSQAGVLYAAHPDEPDPYTAQGYNMHHGWGLWAAAEHYFWTRDREWLQRWAPQLVAACEWVVRERQATRVLRPDGSRPVEYGLAPAGDLEDVEEYLYWYATDAYYHLGMKKAADALQDAATRGRRAGGPGSPSSAAERAAASWGTEELRQALLEAVAEFRQDIQASVAESVATSPVVRLRDGSYVPYVPARAYALTHRKEGWIREVLYGALHLVNGEVYEPGHPYVDWTIQDLEDNLFLSPESGFRLADPRSDFFNFGGFTLQPNLLDLALIYLQRDATPNFLRAFFNTAAASLYPDTMCFAEWLPDYGKGGGPLYKTPDECKFIQWMRQMLVLERGDTLELGLGVPRAWMRAGQRIQIERAATHFGRVDLEIASHADRGQIAAVVTLSPTEPPKNLWLRLRHPEGQPIRAARVNTRPARVDAARQLIHLPPMVNHWQVVAEF
ncbi:MAG: hypothetical protein FJ387_20255 [Verrucomicrobia bacterium]|nr:hypothetical protein [Verrucomicrobiota bacterium]